MRASSARSAAVTRQPGGVVVATCASAAISRSCSAPGSDEPLRERGVGDAGGAPAHAEVALHRATAPHHLDHLAVQRRLLGVGGQRRVDVGRRAADVDEQHVARRRSRRAARRRRGRGRASLRAPAEANRGPGGEALAADDVAHEHVADRGARGHAGRGRRCAAARWRTRRPCAGVASSSGDDLVARVDVARDDVRHPRGRTRASSRRVVHAAPRRRRRRCRRRAGRRRAASAPAASSAVAVEQRRSTRARPWRRPTAPPAHRLPPSRPARSRRPRGADRRRPTSTRARRRGSAPAVARPPRRPPASSPVSTSRPAPTVVGHEPRWRAGDRRRHPRRRRRRPW